MGRRGWRSSDRPRGSAMHGPRRSWCSGSGRRRCPMNGQPIFCRLNEMSNPDRRTFLVQTVGALAGMALLPDLSELSAAVPVRPGREPHKVGLIGVGRQGRAILDELAKIDAVEVAAVCDVVPSRVTAGTERALGAEGFTDHRELLERRPDIEAVIVATPTHLHRE